MSIKRADVPLAGADDSKLVMPVPPAHSLRVLSRLYPNVEQYVIDCNGTDIKHWMFTVDSWD